MMLASPGRLFDGLTMCESYSKTKKCDLIDSCPFFHEFKDCVRFLKTGKCEIRGCRYSHRSGVAFKAEVDKERKVTKDDLEEKRRLVAESMKKRTASDEGIATESSSGAEAVAIDSVEDAGMKHDAVMATNDDANDSEDVISLLADEDLGEYDLPDEMPVQLQVPVIEHKTVEVPPPTSVVRDRSVATAKTEQPSMARQPSSVRQDTSKSEEPSAKVDDLWEKIYSSRAGRYYFYNSLTGTSIWEDEFSNKRQRGDVDEKARIRSPVRDGQSDRKHGGSPRRNERPRSLSPARRHEDRRDRVDLEKSASDFRRAPRRSPSPVKRRETTYGSPRFETPRVSDKVSSRARASRISFWRPSEERKNSLGSSGLANAAMTVGQEHPGLSYHLEKALSSLRPFLSSRLAGFELISNYDFLCHSGGSEAHTDVCHSIPLMSPLLVSSVSEWKFRKRICPGQSRLFYYGV